MKLSDVPFVLRDGILNQVRNLQSQLQNVSLVNNGTVDTDGEQSTMESEKWYVGKISRRRAELMVLPSNLPKGAFLIRERDTETDTKEFALTVKDSDDHGNATVKHYIIKRPDADQGYFITFRRKFPTIPDLVRYYRGQADGLCCHLTQPAPNPPELGLSLDTVQTWQNWDLQRDQLSMKRKLGYGHFGEVWWGKWRDIVEVTIKMSDSQEQFLRESEIMKQLDHWNIVKLYGVCSLGEPFYIIYEYLGNGTLIDYLRNDGSTLELKTIVDMSAQIANGMKYLEDRNLVHRALAARNILLGDKVDGVPVAKVANFSLARKEKDIHEANDLEFPIKWTAPEAMATGRMFTVKSDVWSYGILVNEIMTKGQKPYPNMHDYEVLEQVNLGYRMPVPPGCPEEIYEDVMIKCWDQTPERRPSFNTLYRFFDDYFVSTQPNYAPPSA